MDDILKVTGLNKSYDNFSLKDVSFTLPEGCITGFIGVNGAGKTTTLRSILGLTSRISGHINFFGMDIEKDARKIKDRIGVVLDDGCFYDELSLAEMKDVIASAYSAWSERDFKEYLERFELSPKQKINTLSKGMKMKYSIAVAFSHHVKLLILDEATSGLDPIMRDEVLDMLLEFIQDEDHAVLVSSHITSDLEKVADYIVFLHKGKIIFSSPKDDLLENYGIIKCGANQFAKIRKEDILSYRKLDCEWQALVANRHEAKKKYPQALVVPASLDEIMLLYVKGEEK